MKAIVTGAKGFAGTHLTAALLAKGYSVLSLDRSNGWPAWAGMTYPGVNFSSVEERISSLASIDELKEILSGSDAEVYHLAGNAFVPESWEKTANTVESNTLIPVRLFEAARDSGFRGRIVFVSSGEVYGSQPRAFSETDQPSPDTPYAQSKLAAESFVPFFVKQGVQIVVSRSFNHIGPGQRNSFVVPSFLSRIRDAMKQGSTAIKTGDLDSGRDFLDVRDVAQAYLLLAQKGETGGVYNVCSGQATKIRTILDTALKVCKANLTAEVDPSLLRKEGRQDRWGSNDRLQTLGWKRCFNIEQTIEDTWKVIQSDG